MVIHKIINSLSTYPQKKDFCVKCLHRISAAIAFFPLLYSFFA